MPLSRMLRAARSLRCFSTAAKKDTLSKWLQEWTAVPKVVVTEGTEPPTAISWLRRRGPPLPEAALHKLFRHETVRLYNPTTQRVGRVTRSRPLNEGAMLLIPKAAVEESRDGSGTGSGRGGGGDDDDSERQRMLSAQQRRVEGEWGARLRASLLHHNADFLAVNKPAGLATQGGKGLAFSLDTLMGGAFGQLPEVQGRQLRLVHRLDRQTTGVILIATNPDAAAWLSTAFRDGSAASSSNTDASDGAGRGRTSAPPAAAAAAAAGAPGISKTYWAVVAKGSGAGSSSMAASLSSSGASSRSSGSSGGKLRARGSIDLPVPSSKDGGQVLHAQTRYRVLHQNERLAWLELQPVTGRKHQLRLHCAQGLQAAILGDSRYSQLRSPGQEAALAALRRHVSGSDGGGGGSQEAVAPLFLHCRSLQVKRPGRRGTNLELSAPLPDSWRALLRQQGWPLPSERV